MGNREGIAMSVASPAGRSKMFISSFFPSMRSRFSGGCRAAESHLGVGVMDRNEHARVEGMRAFERLLGGGHQLNPEKPHAVDWGEYDVDRRVLRPILL